jgi:hypothetical protein
MLVQKIRYNAKFYALISFLALLIMLKIVNNSCNMLLSKSYYKYYIPKGKVVCKMNATIIENIAITIMFYL